MYTDFILHVMSFSKKCIIYPGFKAGREVHHCQMVI